MRPLPLPLPLLLLRRAGPPVAASCLLLLLDLEEGLSSSPAAARPVCELQRQRHFPGAEAAYPRWEHP